MYHAKQHARLAHILRFDNVLDVYNAARRAHANGGRADRFAEPESRIMGKSFRGWDQFRAALLTPWEGADKAVGQIAAAVRARADIEKPMDIKRRARWSEIDGDVDCDRAYRGEPDMFREVRREHRPAMQNVLLLCELEAVGDDYRTSIFWRAAALCATADLLEGAGFSCEIWGWCRGTKVYYGDYHNSFVCWRLKEAGAVADRTSITNGLSVWFLMNAVYASMAAAPDAKFKGIGESVGYIGDFMSELDVDSKLANAVRLSMPVVKSAWESEWAVKYLVEAVNRKNLPEPAPAIIPEKAVDDATIPETSPPETGSKGKVKKYKPAKLTRKFGC